MSPQPVPIEDDEILFRRIPVSVDWYLDGILSGQAFAPRKDEHSGISVFRKRFKTLDQVAEGRSKKGYYVVSLRVSDLLAIGIRVEPRPQVDVGWDDAHAELPDLHAGIRKTDDAEQLQEQLAKLGVVIPVAGPFVPPTIA